MCVCVCYERERERERERDHGSAGVARSGARPTRLALSPLFPYLSIPAPASVDLRAGAEVSDVLSIAGLFEDLLILEPAAGFKRSETWGVRGLTLLPLFCGLTLLPVTLLSSERRRVTLNDERLTSSGVPDAARADIFTTGCERRREPLWSCCKPSGSLGESTDERGDKKSPDINSGESVA